MKLSHIIIAIIMLLMTLHGALAQAVLGMSRVTIESNSAQISGEQWVLDVVLDQLNDHIIGIIDNKDIVASDGRVAKYDLGVEAQVTKKSCNYNLITQTSQIYSVYQETFGIAPFCQFDQSGCYNKGGYVALHEAGEVVCRCVFIKPVANHATVDFDKYAFEATIKATANGQVETGIINNADSPDVKVGSNVYVDWVGNLVSGDLCEAASDQDVVAITSSSGSRLTDAGKYNSYTIYDGAGFQNCLELAVGLGGSNTQSCVDEYNTYSSRALETKTFKSTDGSIATVSGSTATIALKKAIQFPNVRMRIKSSWLGIEILTGKPQIQSTAASGFTEGTKTGKITTLVKNIGNAQGSFSLAATCGDNVRQLGSAIVFTLNAGQSQSYDIPLESIKDVTAKETDTCTVTFKERNTGESATQAVTVSVYPQRFCSSGDFRCDGEKYYSCNSNGQWIQDATKNGECTIQCSIDADCNDQDSCTIDKCSGLGATGKVCTHEVQTQCAQAECEAQGKVWHEQTTIPPAWQFWASSKTTGTCLNPHFSIVGALLLVAGIGLLIALPGMPPAMIAGFLMILSGIIMLIAAGVGII